MHQTQIPDQVITHIVGAMRYMLADRQDVQQAGVLWGYLLALRDVEAITVAEWGRWQSALSTAEMLFTGHDLTDDLMREILSCDGPLEVLEIWRKRKLEAIDG
ncbi:MAG: hypothetical protein IJQ31_15015 [Thermoguttaceae bacterium]|nr:hypothetical protein [Thermoguttaceae bacterium]